MKLLSSRAACLPVQRTHESLQLDKDAKLLLPYLHDPEKGVLPRLGGDVLPGYQYTTVGVGGHSRGGGVIAYAYSHSIVKDGDFSAVVFMDPVTAFPSDVPQLSATLIISRSFVFTMLLDLQGSKQAPEKPSGILCPKLGVPHWGGGVFITARMRVPKVVQRKDVHLEKTKVQAMYSAI